MELPDTKPNHTQIEAKWQDFWQRTSQDIADILRAERPYFNLMMFPYPSAEGLHVGNMYAFTGSDIHGRYMRMQGHDVFEPIGLDGFGIHSENFALKIGRHPKEHAIISEKNFYQQLHTIGASFDWSRTVETYNPNYYRWTQWIFTKMFEHGLAYRGTAPVTWCGNCKTVLSDEQVLQKDGNDICERCGNKVEKKLMEQWFFRITAYAGKLLENIPKLNWSEKVKTTQEKWIGKKDGLLITYPVVTAEKKQIAELTCFTTRPDTNFGATFIGVSPEYQYISNIINNVSEDIKKQIVSYQQTAKKKTDQERIAEGKKKTGINTGLYCLHPLNQQLLPIYISDFVLAGYGTGVVVGVPGHDTRDFEFAEEMHIPIIRVIVGKDGDTEPITKKEQVYEDVGITMNSEFLDGLDTPKAIVKMADYMEEKGWGKRTTTYHLRDWTISRQRYWGAPIPMIFCEACREKGSGGHKDMPGWWAVPENQLPVLLPDIEDYKPRDDGVGPLAKHKEFYEVACPHCGVMARRETDVCDTFLDSSWYHLRYPTVSSSAADQVPFDPEITKKWLPVAMYTGGAEHSVLHLMYARFVTMALHDMGYLSFDEPYTNFFAHGLVIKDGAKMSKSKGNVVNPDEYIKKYGADALRMYLMFMGPFADGGDFRDTGMEGMHRFISRIWRLVMASANKGLVDCDGEIHRQLQMAIRRASDDLPKRRYNTTIAGFMEFINAVQDSGKTLGTEDAKDFVKIIAPFAPHTAEELWFQLTVHKNEISPEYVSVHKQPWPLYDKNIVLSTSIQFVIQVNGKVRDTVSLTPDQANDKKVVEELAQSREKVQKFFTTQPQKIIFVPGKLINFVL